MEQLVGVDAVAPSHHGELFLCAPATTPLLAEDFNGFIFDRVICLPIMVGRKPSPVLQGARSSERNTVLRSLAILQMLSRVPHNLSTTPIQLCLEQLG